MKPGYSFIEIMVGIFLASLLAISLFQSVRNTSSTVTLADDIMDLDMRVATFHHQFERDTIGIFMLEDTAITQTTEDKNVPPSSEKKGENAVENAKKGGEKIDAQKTQKNPEKLFYAVNTDSGHVEEFTFITSNPARVYEKAANVTAKPRMVRVLYRLVKDPKQEDSYILMRQEGHDLDTRMLDPKTQAPVRSYALLTHIKKLSFDFSYPVKSGKNSNDKDAPAAAEAKDEKKKQPMVEKFITRSDWPFKTKEEAREKKVPGMPQTIIARVELWDASHASFREFTLQYPIASFTLEEAKKKRAQKKAPPPAQKPTETTAKKRVDLSLVLKPKTEEKLAQLGDKVFKFHFEGTIKDPDVLSLRSKRPAAVKGKNLFVAQEKTSEKANVS